MPQCSSAGLSGKLVCPRDASLLLVRYGCGMDAAAQAKCIVPTNDLKCIQCIMLISNEDAPQTVHNAVLATSL